jgi:hypothetical protein
MTKQMLELAPRLTNLKLLSKALSWVDFRLEIPKSFLDDEKSTKDGLTTEHDLKAKVALSDHIVSCATFVMVGPAGGIITKGLSALLILASNWLASKDMEAIINIAQSGDTLLFEYKLTHNMRAILRPNSA